MTRNIIDKTSTSGALSVSVMILCGELMMGNVAIGTAAVTYCDEEPSKKLKDVFDELARRAGEERKMKTDSRLTWTRLCGYRQSP